MGTASPQNSEASRSDTSRSDTSRSDTSRSDTSRSDTSHHSLIASDRVEGTSVRRPNGDKIGTIMRLMIDKVSGQVAYAVLSFGGFLGIGEKHMPIAWERLRYDPLLGAYELDITDDEMAKAPSYAADPSFDWGDRSQELRAYYRMPPYPGI